MLVCLLGLGVTLCLFVLELAESYLTFTAEQLRREWKRGTNFVHELLHQNSMGRCHVQSVGRLHESPPGCANCYAAARNHRFGNDNWGKGKPRRRTAPANWWKPIVWNVKLACDDCNEIGVSFTPNCEGRLSGLLRLRRINGDSLGASPPHFPLPLRLAR